MCLRHAQEMHMINVITLGLRLKGINIQRSKRRFELIVTAGSKTSTSSLTPGDSLRTSQSCQSVSGISARRSPEYDYNSDTYTLSSRTTPKQFGIQTNKATVCPYRKLNQNRASKRLTVHGKALAAV